MNSFGAARVAPEEAVFRPALPMSIQPGLKGTDMSDLIHIPPNVWEFINAASEAVGRMERDRFSQEMQSQLVETHLVESPIEQLFLVALHAMARANFEDINPDPIDVDGEWVFGCGLHLSSQFQVDKYRVDFMVSRAWKFKGQNLRDSVIVELDGHEFHDKDKRQRSYEKARDRHLTRQGFKVLHYTGSDVVRDPFRVAHEVMDTIECFGPVGLQKYDPADPLGQGD